MLTRIAGIDSKDEGNSKKTQQPKSNSVGVSIATQSNNDIEDVRGRAVDKNGNTLRPVYRLDFNAEGLCLVSNNGALCRLLDSPEVALKRKYRVRVHGLITESKLHGLRRGLTVDGIKYKPIECSIDRAPRGTNSWLTLTLTESKAKAIKKCLKSLYLNVQRIICVGFGPYNLGDLKPGAYQELELTPELLTLWRTRHIRKPDNEASSNRSRGETFLSKPPSRRAASIGTSAGTADSRKFPPRKMLR